MALMGPIGVNTIASLKRAVLEGQNDGKEDVMMTNPQKWQIYTLMLTEWVDVPHPSKYANGLM
jgi:hypothetical protein